MQENRNRKSWQLWEERRKNEVSENIKRRRDVSELVWFKRGHTTNIGLAIARHAE